MTEPTDVDLPDDALDDAVGGAAGTDSFTVTVHDGYGGTMSPVEEGILGDLGYTDAG